MNSDQLRQFEAIAKYGNLTKAAEQLYITQPALSSSLSKLEDEIGKLLFIWEGRQLKLTENGEKLLHYAHIVTQAIDEAKECFRVPDNVWEINIYRIGGVGAHLLLSGSYDLPDYRLKLNLVHNWETPDIVGKAIAVFIIADERYMNSAVYAGVEKVFLCRRGGATAAWERLNLFFGMTNCIVPASQYWNMVHGFSAEDVEKDAEGLQTMRTLADNLAWIIEIRKAGEAAGIQKPLHEPVTFTNFIA